MRAITKFSDGVERWVTYAAILGIVLAVLWGVLTRYVTERPAAWTPELSGILFTWAVFIGAATAFREKRHICIDLVPHLLPKPARRVLELIARLSTLAFLGFAALLSFQMMLKGATRPSPVLRIPFSYVYLAPFLSFSLMAITDVLRFVTGTADGQQATAKDIL